MLERIPLSYYSVSGLCNFLTSLTLCIFVFLKNPKSRTNQAFSLFTFAVAGWGLFYFLWLHSQEGAFAEFYLRTLMLFVIFIPATFTHFILTFLKVDVDKRVIIGNYGISLLLGVSVYSTWFAGDLGPYLIFPFWLKPGLIFHLHLLHFMANILCSHYLMLREMKHRSGIVRNQILYIFLGTGIGYLSGITNYLTWYRMGVPPFLTPLVCLYVAFIGYAIVKYRTMDISVAINQGLAYAVLLTLALFPIYLLVLVGRRATLHGIPPLLAATLIFACGLWIVLMNPRRAPNVTFSLICFAVSLWLFGLFMAYSARDSVEAMFWSREMYIGIVYIPAFFYHFSEKFLQRDRKTVLIYASYFISTLFLFLVPTGYLINGVSSFPWGYYPRAGVVHPVFLLYFGASSGISLKRLYAAAKEKEGHNPLETVRIKYIFWAFVVGYIASIDYLQLYGASFYPTGFLFVTLWTMIVTYAISKYQVLDVSVIVTKEKLLSSLQPLSLIGLYLCILGVIRIINGSLQYLLSGVLFSLFVLAAGVIYGARRQLERVIQRTLWSKSYQTYERLENFTRSMVMLQDPHELTKQIVDQISESFSVRCCSLFIQDPNGDYERSASNEGTAHPLRFIKAEEDRGFFSWLEQQTKVVELQELEHGPENESVLPGARRYFTRVNAEICLPIVHKRKLIGIINLGEKNRRAPYTQIDVETLSRFGDEASVALANALVYHGQRQISQELEHQVEQRTRELSESKSELELSYGKLKELDTLKSEFFANISHELRTPLTLILAPVQSLLNHPGLPGDLSRQINIMYQNGLRLLKLINNLLDFAKIDAGKAALSYARLDFNNFAREILSSVMPLAEKKNILISLSCPEASMEFYFDADRIEKVLLNLIFNAIKFTPTGGHVDIDCRRENGNLVVKVADTGIGIKEADIQRLFNRFSQIDASASRQYEGTGLGLALAKELVELHKGRIWAESEPGKGTVMTFELPYCAAHPKGKQTEIEPLESGEVDWTRSLQKAAEYSTLGIIKEEAATLVPISTAVPYQESTILLVEDNPDMLGFLTAQLQDQYRVITAVDGVEGVTRARADYPTLIISDVMMPRMDGYQLCRELKKDPATMHIPIILLTAKTDLSMKIEGLECGADDYLTKPFSSEEVRARIRSLLNQQKIENQLIQSEKMAAVGLLVAGVAHEVNNPVNSAKLSASNCARLLEKYRQKVTDLGVDPNNEEVKNLNERINRAVEVVKTSLERIEGIVSDLKSFVRKDEIHFRPTNLHQGLDSTIAILDYELQDRKRIVKEYGEIGEIDVIAGQINQVFMNLIQNAIHAIPRSREGEILIRTSREEDWVKVSIRDNGDGIPAENLKRIFDPFFTTKEVGKGTGLGLSVCHRILQNHGGRIEVRSEVGLYTEMLVHIPIRKHSAGELTQAEQTGKAI